MRKLILTFAAAALFSGLSAAAPLTPEQALSNIEKYARHNRVKGLKASQSQLSLGYTARLNGAATLYVFNNSNDGFIIASADSKAVPVLGYSDKGSIDYNNIPDNLKYWLDFYSHEIATVANAENIATTADATADYQPIEPIAKTTWDQSTPYNNLCPVFNGRRSVTGCVATAMAQAMKCVEWPEHGTGSNSYQLNGTTVSANFAESTYAWDDMLNTYSNVQATDAQKTAVATLMRDCGISVNMEYSPVESSATSMAIPVALIKYFDYDKAAHNLSREFYGLLEWEKIVYDELAAGRPVIYAGTTEEQYGHCFLCDGYSSDRYFHINWGWNGLSDGYYRLSALTPENQGIGGSNGGYNINQTVTIGMKKPEADSNYFIQMCCQGKFGTQALNYAPTQSSMVTFTSDVFYNGSIVDMSGVFGVCLTDENGDKQYVPGLLPTNMQSSMGVTSYIVLGNAFPTSGTYKVTPAFRANSGEWYDVRIGINYPQYMMLEATPTMLKFSQTALTATIKAKDVKINSEIYSNARFSVSATFYTDGDEEYYGPVSAALFDPATSALRAVAAQTTIDVIPGEELPLNYISKFQTTVPDGTYNFGFVDSRNRLISDPISVEIKAVAGDGYKSSLSDFRIANATGNNSTVPANDIQAAGTINCTSGYFAEEITAYIFDETGGNALGALGSEIMFIHEGESQDFLIKGKFSEGTIGAQYKCAIFVESKNYPATVLFTLGEPTSGVSEIESRPGEFTISNTCNNLHIDCAIDLGNVRIYNVSGSLVTKAHGNDIDIAALPSGVYIVVANLSNGQQAAARFIK